MGNRYEMISLFLCISLVVIYVGLLMCSFN
jgi:hypothetical protein